MSELLQTGQHPDADQLSAFVEHALPAHEHQSMLAHLAICPDCRSVVAVSMPPVEELPELQPLPARRPWFAGWNLVWPVAAAFAALIFIAVLVHRGGENAPPTQIAETHQPEKPAVVERVAPAQSRSPAARDAGSPPATQGHSAGEMQAAKTARDKPAVTLNAEDQGPANLPVDGRNIESLPPSPGAPPSRVTAGAAAGKALGEAGMAQQTQVLGGGLNVLPATAPPAAYVMNGLTVAPAAASPAPPVPPPPAAVARAGNGSRTEGASKKVDALSDDALAAESDTNASSTVISGSSLATLAKVGNVAMHPLPSKLPVLSVATAGQTMLALDSGNTLFFSSDGGTHWKLVRPRWQGRVVKVALAVTPDAAKQQPVAANKAEIRGELQGRIHTASAAPVPMAQSAAGGDATLTGQVADPAGAMITGAAVTVTNATTAAAVTVKSDATGRYFAGGLAPGAYRIDATARGFARQELNVTLAASQQAKADLKLQVGQMTETVTVTNSPPQIETESAALSAEMIKSKPNRDTPPVFAITTDTGAKWVSADGQNWKRN
jgi:hypothetical protein